jgi:hypothetical protein
MKHLLLMSQTIYSITQMDFLLTSQRKVHYICNQASPVTSESARKKSNLKKEYHIDRWIVLSPLKSKCSFICEQKCLEHYKITLT